jgi:hypothetical protein
MSTSIKLTDLDKFDASNNKEEEKIQEIISQREDVTESQIRKIWSDFIYNELDPESPQARLLRNRTIHLEETKITIAFENEIQIQKLKEFSDQLMHYMRVQAKNGELGLETKLEEKVEKELIYTSHQKYKVLIEKYPILDDLKQSLGLDLEF